MLSVAKSILINKPIQRFIFKDDSDSFHLQFKQFRENRTSLDCDLRLVREDQAVIWANFKAGWGQNTDGSYACRLAMNDITERKHTQEAFKVSAANNRILMSILPVGVYLCHPDGSCQYTNAKWQEMAGMSLDESLGDGWARGLHPDDREKVLSSWNRMVGSNGTWGLECRFQTPEGKVTTVYGLASPVYDEESRIIGYLH